MSTDIKSLGSFVVHRGTVSRRLQAIRIWQGHPALPFVVLRRLDCILEASKQDVLNTASSLPGDMDEEARDMLLSGVVGQNIRLYNLSRFTFASLKGQDATDIHNNLIDYITRFSGNVRDIFLDKFLFTD